MIRGLIGPGKEQSDVMDKDFMVFYMVGDATI
jgi:hypothetical protein